MIFFFRDGSELGACCAARAPQSIAPPLAASSWQKWLLQKPTDAKTDSASCHRNETGFRKDVRSACELGVQGKSRDLGMAREQAVHTSRVIDHMDKLSSLHPTNYSAGLDLQP